MSPKAIVALLVGLFVLASVILLGYQALTPGRGTSEIPGRGDRVVVFYFHGMTRCKSCRLIETSAHEVLEHDFSAEIADGRLVWAPVNIELVENRHYAKDFEMPVRTVVLVEVKGGQLVRYERLDRTWELSRQGREVLLEYIQTRTTDFLAAAG